jgi:hypothetical protein
MNTRSPFGLVEPPTLPLPTRRWLNPDEAAAYLGVSIPTLKALGVSPSYSLGQRTPRYDVHELDRAMQTQQTDTAEKVKPDDD